MKLYDLIPVKLKENLEVLKSTLVKKYPGLQLNIHKMMSKKEIYLSKI